MDFHSLGTWSSGSYRTLENIISAPRHLTNDFAFIQLPVADIATWNGLRFVNVQLCCWHADRLGPLPAVWTPDAPDTRGIFMLLSARYTLYFSHIDLKCIPDVTGMTAGLPTCRVQCSEAAAGEYRLVDIPYIV
jgi:hypothetical protein